ncbi:MAG: coenzyme F420-0:L-glutamate ligase [Anaerolineales bacterium]|nr:coenzyme F420-0:L-glutamate ligase [Anaerolineales bacterium]
MSAAQASAPAVSAPAATLTLTALPGLPLVQPGDDLAALILAALGPAGLTLRDGDVIAIAQKIVSKAEGRLVRLADVTPSPRALELAALTEKDARFVEVVLSESSEVLRARPNTLIVEHRLGFVCANAGLDRSNVAPHGEGLDEWVLMLPADPDRSCAALRARWKAETGADVGVVINDSHGRAWRTGTVGVALGVAGMPGLLDLRGHPDLFDYALQITQIGLGDELAAAASLLMGQADEGRPVIHLRGLPYALREGSAQELIRPKSQDLFRDRS